MLQPQRRRTIHYHTAFRFSIRRSIHNFFPIRSVFVRASFLVDVYDRLADGNFPSVTRLE